MSRWFTDAQVTDIARSAIAITRQYREGTITATEYRRRVNKLNEAWRELPAGDQAAINKRVTELSRARSR